MKYTLTAVFVLCALVANAQSGGEPSKNDAKTHSDNGLAWIEKGEYDKGIQDLNEAIKLDSMYAPAYCYRGIALIEKGESDKAIQDLNKAIELDSKNAMAYSNRARAWMEKREPDKAIEDYNEVIKLNPRDAMAYIDRGSAWEYKFESDKAIQDYSESIRLNPKDVMGYFYRGIAWDFEGEYEKAIKDYNEVIKLDPNSPAAIASVADIMATCPDAKFRNGARAVELATKACELTMWKDSFYISTLAAAYAESGDFEKAVKWESEANNIRAKNGMSEPLFRLERRYKRGLPFRR